MAAQQIEAQEGRVILIPVDNSETAKNAFFFYVDNLRKEGDKIVFIHVPESYDFWQTPAALKQELMDSINKHVKDLEIKYDQLVHTKGVTTPRPVFKTRAGRPGEEVMKLAKELEPTFIVCGSRGLGTYRRTFLGSVSDFILHHSHVPVVIFHDKN